MPPGKSAMSSSLAFSSPVVSIFIATSEPVILHLAASVKAMVVGPDAARSSWIIAILHLPDMLNSYCQLASLKTKLCPHMQFFFLLLAVKNNVMQWAHPEIKLGAAGASNITFLQAGESQLSHTKLI